MSACVCLCVCVYVCVSLHRPMDGSCGIELLGEEVGPERVEEYRPACGLYPQDLRDYPALQKNRPASAETQELALRKLGSKRLPPGIVARRKRLPTDPRSISE